jgi:hypothetical protein
VSHHRNRHFRGRFFRWLAGMAMVAAVLPGPPAAAQNPDGGLKAPRTLAADRAGNLLVTDTENHRIVRIDPSGGMTVVAGTGQPGDSGDGGPPPRPGSRIPMGSPSTEVETSTSPTAPTTASAGSTPPV